MKKIILILAVLFMALGMSAQITKNKTLNSSQYYFEDRGDYSLTILGDSVLNYTIQLNKADELLYDVQLKLDSVSGTPNYTIDLKGKRFIGDVWSDLETDVVWTGTSSDTTILFQEHSTAIFYRYLQLQVKGSAGTGAATFDKLEVATTK